MSVTKVNGPMNMIPGSSGMNAAGQTGKWGQNNTFIPDSAAGTTRTADPAANGYTATSEAANAATGDTATSSAGGGKGISYLQSGQAYALRSSALEPAERSSVLSSLGVLGAASRCIATTGPVAQQHAGALMAGAGFQADPSAMSERVHRIIRNQYANLFVASSFGGISCAESSIANAFANIEIGLGQTLHNVEKSFKEKFKPYGKHIGSTLVNLNNVLKDPIGHGLVPAANALMKKINPHFAESHAGAWLSKRMEDVQHFPGALYGSLRHMQSALTGGQLFGPIQFVKDLYLGAMAIMKAVGKLINDAFKTIQQFVFSILDDLLGGMMSTLISILDTISSYASIIGSIAGMFGGLSAITNFAGQLTGMLGTFSSILSNPMGMAMRFLPPQIGQGLSFLSNPEALLANLPPPFNTIFCILNAISGQGYSGNLGYALYGLLSKLKIGSLAQIMSTFNCMMPMLDHLLPPTQPYQPATYPNKYTTVQVPGRPGYLYDSNGNVVKSPCAGPPKAPYDTDNNKSTIGAPSTTSAAEAAARSVGGDGSSTVPGPASLNPTDGLTAQVAQQAGSSAYYNPVTQQIEGQFAGSLNQAFQPAAALTDSGSVNFNNLTGYSSSPTGPGTTPTTAAANYPTSNPIRINMSTEGLNDTQTTIPAI